jgi:predicted MFS family arabinose efflux permease
MKDAIEQFSNRNVFLALIGAAVIIGAAVSLHFLPAFLASDPTISPAARAIILTLMGLSGSAGAFFAPALSDRIGRKQCLLLATIGMVLHPMALIFVPGHHAFLVLAFLASFVGGGGMTLMVYVIPGETVSPNVAATVYAMLLCFGELLGGSTAPAFAGLLADHFGLAAALWLTTALGAAAFITALGVREPVHRGALVPGLEAVGGVAINSDALIE